MSTKKNFNYTETTLTETVLPITYIEKYSDTETKARISEYKFSSQPFSKNLLVFNDKIIDLSIYLILKVVFSNKKSLILFTSPPSTMHARKEKSEDSMWEIMRECSRTLHQYIKHPSRTHVLYMKVYSLSTLFLRKQRAQHIGGTRKTRTLNLEKRYTLKCSFRLKLLWLIYMRKLTHIEVYVIDDIASTGGTLLACRYTLESHLLRLQKKKPAISFDIQVFSLTH